MPLHLGHHSSGYIPTLLNAKLNSSVSNNPWPDKKAEFLKYAVLNLNGELMDVGHWDDDSIRERSGKLARLVAQCWPDRTSTDEDPTC